jgi:hypothetical protein
MTKPIELYCLYWDDSQAQLNDLGIRPSIEQCELKPIMFFKIDHIKPYIENEHSFTTVVSGGEEYIAKVEYEALKNSLKLIN